MRLRLQTTEDNRFTWSESIEDRSPEGIEVTDICTNCDGTLHVMLYNHNSEPYIIKQGEFVVRFIFDPIAPIYITPEGDTEC